MRTNLNFSPLFRSTIGFDRVFDLLENASRAQSFESWPPYDIVRTLEDSYRITMAVAGFGENDIDIVSQENQLTVSGRISGKDNGADGVTYLHRGIAERAFERRFQLADHIRL